MTVKEFVNRKVQELEAQKCKDVRIIDVSECKIGKHSYSFILFNKAPVDMTAEIVDRKDLVFEDEYLTEHKGAMVTIAFVKPRCRKISRESYHTAIKEGAKTAVA
jgi:hypothetical protein